MNENNNNEDFWFNDISVLFNTNNLLKYFPSSNMTLNEILNSLVRLSFYVSVIFVIFRRSINYIFMTAYMLIITYLIYFNLSEKDKKKYENFENNTFYDKDNYVSPTKDNPFMNVLQSDYENNTERIAENEAELYNETKYEEIQEEVNDNFDNDLYKDMTDIYNNRNSQRQFYTTPNTQIPNDQTSFAKWCYGTPATCKEGNNLQCFNNLPTTFGDPGLRGKSQNSSS